MKKIILVGMMVMSMAGCSSFIPRQDLYEKAEFKDEKIVKGRNDIEIYEVDYPEDYYERLEFFRDFELAGKKMLLEDKALNLMVSKELFDALERFKKGEFLDEEGLYIKTASDLDEFQQQEIDERIIVSVTERGGQVQKYLNKQVKFWMEVTGKEGEFDGSKLYTELDKQRLMEEVRGTRKEFFQVLNAMRMSVVIKVSDPYSEENKSRGYWASKEIDLFNPTGISRGIQSIGVPIYIDGLTDTDIKNVLNVREDFSTPILILESESLKGYTVRDEKYVFYHGGDTLRGYYKDYDLRVEITPMDLKNLVTIEEGILLSDVLRRSQVKAKGITEEKEVKEVKSLDWGLE